MRQKLFSLAKNSIGNLIAGLVFEKASKLLPINRIYESEKVVAFWHPKPLYEKHILIVPKKKIRDISILRRIDDSYILEIFETASKIIKDLNLNKKDYSIITNGGSRQEIKQLYFHLISGKKLS